MNPEVEEPEKILPFYPKLNKTEKHILHKLVEAQRKQNNTEPLVPKNITVTKRVVNRCKPDPEAITSIICQSPPHLNRPGPVNITVLYEEDGPLSESNPVIFTYYETPILISIWPPCGPTYG